MDKYKNKYRIPSTRLQNWDYRWDALYFITICTKNRKYFFGNIIDNNIQLTKIGEIAQKYWNEIPEHFSCVKLDEFIIMPNHIHGIIEIHNHINSNGNTNVQTRQCLVSTTTNTDIDNPNTDPVQTRHRLVSTKKTIGQKRFQNQGKNSLSSIIGSYKSVVTKNARKIQPHFGWQPRFHDRIIRDETAYQNIKNYIINNPKKWNDHRVNI